MRWVWIVRSCWVWRVTIEVEFETQKFEIYYIAVPDREMSKIQDDKTIVTDQKCPVCKQLFCRFVVFSFCRFVVSWFCDFDILRLRCQCTVESWIFYETDIL